MGKGEEKEDRDMQGQWFFVVLATFIAFFAGVGINAAYSLLKYYAYSDWHILFLSAFFTLFLIDVFGYMFSNVQLVRDNPGMPLWDLLKKYFNHRLWKK